MSAISSIIPFGSANSKHALASRRGGARKADVTGLTPDEEVVHSRYEILLPAGIVYDAGATGSERKARHDGNRKRACARIEYDAVKLGAGRDGNVSRVRNVQGRDICWSVWNSRRHPIRRSIPITVEWCCAPGRAASGIPWRARAGTLKRKREAS